MKQKSGSLCVCFPRANWPTKLIKNINVSTVTVLPPVIHNQRMSRHYGRILLNLSFRKGKYSHFPRFQILTSPSSNQMLHKVYTQYKQGTDYSFTQINSNVVITIPASEPYGNVVLRSKRKIVNTVTLSKEGFLTQPHSHFQLHLKQKSCSVHVCTRTNNHQIPINLKGT